MTPAEVARLGTHGWFERDDFTGATAAAAVALGRSNAGRFAPAGLTGDHHRDTTVRSDELLWVNPEDLELGAFHTAFGALRLELNAGAWLGLTRFDLQLAHYPGAGTGYVKHRDAARSGDARRVTAIVYLNPKWEPGHGGLLHLHTEPPVDIAPKLGHLVVFLAGKIEHEVLPSWARRFAATAWYYGN